MTSTAHEDQFILHPEDVAQAPTKSVDVSESPWHSWLERRYGPDVSARIIRETVAHAHNAALSDIEANIASEHYFTAIDGALGAYKNNGDVRVESYKGDWEVPRSIQALGLLTFCVLVLRNGFTVTGESVCTSPDNFDAEVGRKIARANAVQKVWPRMGYEMRTELSATKGDAQPVAAQETYPQMMPAELSQFLSDVMTAASLISHGKQCKALGERLGDACMRLRLHYPEPFAAPVAAQVQATIAQQRKGEGE